MSWIARKQLSWSSKSITNINVMPFGLKIQGNILEDDETKSPYKK